MDFVKMLKEYDEELEIAAKERRQRNNSETLQAEFEAGLKAGKISFLEDMLRKMQTELDMKDRVLAEKDHQIRRMEEILSELSRRYGFSMDQLLPAG
ncbi:MAG: hypothetical protein E7190_12205 [Erysipelotrichaceae bacterium]|nr:hypothetical protein [Erysipelotrichaceae bacterium]